MPSSENVSGAKLFEFGRTLTLYFDYFVEDEPRRTGIRFHGVVIAQKRCERFASSWNVKSYDTLTEIHKSPWVEQIKQELSGQYGHELDRFRHFAIYLESLASLEVICTGFDLIQEEPGSWETLNVNT